DPPSLDRRGDASGRVQERIEIGVGEELAEHLEAALPAPHSGQPVVDQRHPHSSSIAVPCFPAPRDAALENGLSSRLETLERRLTGESPPFLSVCRNLVASTSPHVRWRSGAQTEDHSP